jgi:FO synthase
MDEHTIRRALRRAEDGRTLSNDEAAALLSCSGEHLERLMAAARQVRDAGPNPRLISLSKKVFIPLTRLCRDRCGYCTFATTPDRVPAAYLDLEEVTAIASAGREAGCKEALFTLGDRPEKRYPEAREWLASRGYDSTLDYLRAASIAVIEATGLLPHLNPGVMSYTEMAALKPVSASMGMMLETTSEALYRTPGAAHFGSPDKNPAVRIRTIEDAGRLAIPFTTGILIGIGETDRDVIDSLLTLRDLHRRYGHIQEVIVQNFVAKPTTAMGHHPDASMDRELATIAVARLLLGPKMVVQAPPNLSDDRFPRLFEAGIGDLGGVSPVTPDHVNPEKPWPALDRIEAAAAELGYEIRERLTVYPRFALEPDPWLDGRMRGAVQGLMSADGFARADAICEPLAWQAPDIPVVAPGAGAAMAEDASIEILERGARGDTDVVHGSWEMLEVPISRTWMSRPRAGGSRMRLALQRAESGVPLSDEDALVLFDASGDDLEALCRVADEARAEDCGETVTYVVNRNINFTNICYVGCRFCAFAQRRDDPDAYFLSLEQVADRAEEAWLAGATEVCLQGGIHPDLPGDHYFDILKAIKARVPDMHLHAFSPMEVLNGATRSGLDFRDWLTRAKEAGLGSMPGTAAEILDDEVRWVLTKGKLPADTWEEIVRTAHAVGIPTTSTMMYGHVDAPPHWVAHLRRLRRIQEDTGGITEFVPLPFVHQNSPIYLAGKARPGATSDENRRVHAIARLMLRGAIEHIQVSWVKLGLDGSQVMLQGGACDLGGTLMEETISRMAGSEHGIRKEPAELDDAIRAIGRIPAQRTTAYEILQT